MKICIVSPHLDDAILSCGIAMQRHKATTDEILVLNIFTAGTNSENRKKEDRLAAEKIGARPFFLDELDAPDRDPRYQTNQQLFFGALEDIPAPYIAKVEGLIRAFFSEHKIDLAYFPLAAGTHIDHRIAFTAGMAIRSTAVKFYEDRPYILWPGILQSRMNEIGSDAILPKITEGMMRETLDSRHFLKHFVPDADQETCLPLYFSALNRPSSKRLRAKSETLAATETEMKKLYDCLSLYESQMKYIYSSYDNFREDNLAYERANSGKALYAERSWTFERL